MLNLNILIFFLGLFLCCLWNSFRKWILFLKGEVLKIKRNFGRNQIKSKILSSHYKRRKFFLPSSIMTLPLSRLLDDASSSVLFAKVWAEASGWRASPSPSWDGLPTGLQQPGAELLTLVLFPHRPRPCHHHRHLPTLDPRPHQPDDTSAPGAHRNILAKHEWPWGHPAQVAGGGHAGVWGKDCWAGEGQEGHVLPVCIQGWSGESKPKLLSGVHASAMTFQLHVCRIHVEDRTPYFVQPLTFNKHFTRAEIY